jgi:nucleoside permease NupC
MPKRIIVLPLTVELEVLSLTPEDEKSGVKKTNKEASQVKLKITKGDDVKARGKKFDLQDFMNTLNTLDPQNIGSWPLAVKVLVYIIVFSSVLSAWLYVSIYQRCVKLMLLGSRHKKR